MTLHRFHYNQEMPTVAVMGTHGKTLAEYVPTDPNMHSPFQETLGKKKPGYMNLIQAQNWKLKWHLVYTKPRMLLINHHPRHMTPLWQRTC